VKPSFLAACAAVLVLAGCKATKPDPEMFPEVQYSMQTFTSSETMLVMGASAGGRTSDKMRLPQ